MNYFDPDGTLVHFLSLVHSSKCTLTKISGTVDDDFIVESINNSHH